MNVGQIWRSIDGQIEKRTPQFNGLLNPPAKESQISDTETHIGMSFPPSVRDSYLIHDGESSESDGLIDLWRLLPLAEVKTWWDEMKLIEETYSFGEFDIQSMIPILFREGDLMYVDQSTNGEETPLFEWRHSDPTRDQQATNFAQYLSSFAEDFESGKMIAEPEYRLKAIVRR